MSNDNELKEIQEPPTEQQQQQQSNEQKPAEPPQPQAQLAETQATQSADAASENPTQSLLRKTIDRHLPRDGVCGPFRSSQLDFIERFFGTATVTFRGHLRWSAGGSGRGPRSAAGRLR